MNCDLIAPYYEWLERLAFGRSLQRHRTAYIDVAAGRHRALVLGDGDGRFTEALAEAYPNLEIHVIEQSAAMIAEARKRLTTHRNAQLVKGDVFEVDFPANCYDILFTHFFLDCFNDDELTRLVWRVHPVLAADAVWIVSDFKQCVNGWKRLYTRLWLFSMYLFFRMATGLKTTRLPNHAAILDTAGFHLAEQNASHIGMIVSEFWTR